MKKNIAYIKILIVIMAAALALTLQTACFHRSIERPDPSAEDKTAQQQSIMTEQQDDSEDEQSDQNGQSGQDSNDSQNNNDGRDEQDESQKTEEDPGSLSEDADSRKQTEEPQTDDTTAAEPETTTEKPEETKAMLTPEDLYVPDITKLAAGIRLSEEMVEMYGEDNFFYVEEISDDVFARMDGLTFKDYSPVTREELRYIRCLHKDIDGNIFTGELVMHESVAYDICDIFHELYKASYPIEKMLLADDYDAEDLVSAADNNTSGFNVRYVEFTNILCRHAYGMAIDINPLYNPYYIHDRDLALPENGYAYTDRNAEYPYKIEEGDLCWQLFTERGFEWGGIWYDPDFMHFQK